MDHTSTELMGRHDAYDASLNIIKTTPTVCPLNGQYLHFVWPQ